MVTDFIDKCPPQKKFQERVDNMIQASRISFLPVFNSKKVSPIIFPKVSES